MDRDLKGPIPLVASMRPLDQRSRACGTWITLHAAKLDLPARFLPPVEGHRRIWLGSAPDHAILVVQCPRGPMSVLRLQHTLPDESPWREHSSPSGVVWLGPAVYRREGVNGARVYVRKAAIPSLSWRVHRPRLRARAYEWGPKGAHWGIIEVRLASLPPEEAG